MRQAAAGLHPRTKAAALPGVGMESGARGGRGVYVRACELNYYFKKYGFIFIPWCRPGRAFSPQDPAIATLLSPPPARADGPYLAPWAREEPARPRRHRRRAGGQGGGAGGPRCSRLPSQPRPAGSAAAPPLGPR